MQIKEEEIRPEQVFNEYLRLTEKDTETYFNHTGRSGICCPACGELGNPAIEKHGFVYEECPKCKTLFVSPRPPKEVFDAYYTDSPSTKFWATTFYKVTESARREKLWKPKAQMVKDVVLAHSTAEKPIKYIIDIGGGYGVFDEEIEVIMDIKSIVIEPSVHLAAVCRTKNLEVVEKFMEDISKDELPQGRKCFVSFELFEHLYNPENFLETVFNCMQTEDLFIFTTLSGMGLDIQVLGSHAKAVSPPHHLNFFNPKSAKILLEKVGFQVLSTKTPGKLDVDILANGKKHIKDKFWLNFLEYANEEEKEKMQQNISEQGFSSHMMIICTK